MPARGTRELLEKRRESDEQRVGERFGKVMRVELVGCKQEGEHNLENARGRVESRGTDRGQASRTHSGARTLRVKAGTGRTGAGGGEARLEGWRRRRRTTTWGKSQGASRGTGGWLL